MTVDLDQNALRIAREIARVRRVTDDQARASQASRRSVELSPFRDGVNYYLPGGDKIATVGLNPRGDFVIERVPEASPTPPTPSAPFATGRVGGVEIAWDGTYENGETWSGSILRIEVHAKASPDTPASDLTQIGTFTSRLGGAIFYSISQAAGEMYYSLQVVSVAERESEESVSTPATAIDAVDAQQWQEHEDALENLNEVVLPALEQELSDASTAVAANQAAVENLTTVTLPALQTDLNNAEAAVAANQAIVDTLNNITIPGLQDAVDAANADITAAETAINNLNTITLPALGTRLDTAEADIDAAQAAVNTLNTVTLPGLQSDVDANAALIQDLTVTTIPNLQGSLDTANAAINQRVRVLFQTAQPGGLGANDRVIWYDTDNGNSASYWNGASWGPYTLGAGALAADSVTATQIAAGQVFATELATDSVIAAKIQAGAIIAGKIAADAVTANTIAADAVTAAKIQAGAVVAGKIAANAVTATTIAAGAVVAGKIAADAVTATNIAAGAVVADKIAAGSIDTAMINAGGLNANVIQFGTMSGARIQAGTIVISQIDALQSTLDGKETPAGAQAKATAAQVAALEAESANTNSIFSDWTGTVPANWGTWGTVNPIKNTALSLTGPNAVEFVTDAVTNAGMAEGTSFDAIPIGTEYITVTLPFYLKSGSLSGAGLLLDWTGMTGGNRSSLKLKDVVPSPVLNKWYLVTQVVRRPAGATGTQTSWGGYLMANYPSDGLGALATKNIVFDRVGLRPSTAEEIAAYDTQILTNGWRYNTTTTINGGVVATGTVLADAIGANQIIAGKIAADAVTATTIAAGAVTAAKVAANTLTANEINANAITASELATDSVVATKIQAGAVIAGKIAADAVTATTIAAGAVVAGKLAANAVTATTIASGAVTAGKIAANAVTAGTIAAGAVTATTIAADAIDGKTITGAVFRTAAPPFERIEMNTDTRASLIKFFSGSPNESFPPYIYADNYGDNALNGQHIYISSGQSSVGTGGEARLLLGRMSGSRMDINGVAEYIILIADDPTNANEDQLQLRPEGLWNISGPVGPLFTLPTSATFDINVNSVNRFKASSTGVDITGPLRVSGSPESGTFGSIAGWTNACTARCSAKVVTVTISLTPTANAGANAQAALIPNGWKPAGRLDFWGTDVNTGNSIPMYIDTNGAIRHIFARNSGQGSLGYATFVTV